ncbi:unnamed protein product [Cochlearia groenlandica]
MNNNKDDLFDLKKFKRKEPTNIQKHRARNGVKSDFLTRICGRNQLNPTVGSRSGDYLLQELPPTYGGGERD